MYTWNINYNGIFRYIQKWHYSAVITQDIPTNWILICIWLMFSYLIEVCGFWLEKKHTHTIHGKVSTVWLHCLYTNAVNDQNNEGSLQPHKSCLMFKFVQI
jgi:hypothetical protein